MDDLKEISLKEVEYFKQFSLKFFNDKIPKSKYKQFTRDLGIYLEEEEKSFMIKLKISSGIMSRSQLHTIYHMASKNKLNHINFTTKQTIQLDGLNLDGICAILEKGVENNIFTKGADGTLELNQQPIESFTDNFELYEINQILFKQNELYAVYINPNEGVLPLKNLKSLLYSLDKCKKPLIKLSMNYGFYILNLYENEANKLLTISKSFSKNIKYNNQ